MAATLDLGLIADEFFRCSAAGDAAGVAALCAPDCRIKQNIGEESGAGALIGLIEGLAAGGITTSYSDIRRVVTDGVVVEQHVITLRRSDGVEVSGDACVVMRFDDAGMLVRADEYLDGSQFAAIFG